jgi:hypothetical protein
MRGRIRAVTAAAAFSLTTLLLVAGPALACGGLIGPNGAVNLLRTTTLAGYHRGIEHYVTSFEYTGGGGAFGSIIPLPGVPNDVVRGGDWTLQRLGLETDPRAFAFDRLAAVPAAAQSVEILLETKIDALDITVLRGGGAAVGKWATEHGFRLSPDSPEVLDFYADRSPIFLAASFDASAAAARGQQLGDGTPVHITIPTSNPWVPLRILGLGKQASERVEADVYLLTDRRPALLPEADGTDLTRVFDQHASTSLLDDLRSDKGMAWVPRDAWLTRLAVNASAGDLTYDLAVDASGLGVPSREAAGFPPAPMPSDSNAAAGWLAVGMAALAFILLASGEARSRRSASAGA